MRYPSDHKQTRRTQLLQASGALAKQKGFGNTGMDALATAAGVTTGALYSQFGSKADLLQAIVSQELGWILAAFDGLDSPEQLFKALRRYLSPVHAEHPELGCLVPSLGGEIGRADPATREIFERGMLTLHARIAAVLDDPDQAWALMCQAFGGILLARAMASPETRDQLLHSLVAAVRPQLRPEQAAEPQSGASSTHNS